MLIVVSVHTGKTGAYSRAVLSEVPADLDWLEVRSNMYEKTHQQWQGIEAARRCEQIMLVDVAS